jgi:hypothetical protein
MTGPVLGGVVPTKQQGQPGDLLIGEQRPGGHPRTGGADLVGKPGGGQVAAQLGEAGVIGPLSPSILAMRAAIRRRSGEALGMAQNPDSCAHIEARSILSPVPVPWRPSPLTSRLG